MEMSFLEIVNYRFLFGEKFVEETQLGSCNGSLYTIHIIEVEIAFIRMKKGKALELDENMYLCLESHERYWVRLACELVQRDFQNHENAR